jgi:hypothetical protein
MKQIYKMFFLGRFDRYKKVVDCSLHKYYGLNEKINIFVNNGNNELYITIIYKNKHPKYQIKELPKEVNDLIYSYCGDFIEIQAKLACPLTFPYNSPVWNIINVKDNLYNRGIINLEEYYHHIATLANESNINRKNWSPIYGFEKEILRFFMRVNHFESIVEKI